MGFFDAFKSDPWARLTKEQQATLKPFDKADPKKAFAKAEAIFKMKSALVGSAMSDGQFRKTVVSCRFLQQENNWSAEKLVDKIIRDSNGELSSARAVAVYNNAVAFASNLKIEISDLNLKPQPTTSKTSGGGDGQIFVDSRHGQINYTLTSSKGENVSINGAILAALISGAVQTGKISGLDHILDEKGAMKVLPGRAVITQQTAQQLCSVLTGLLQNQSDVPDEFRQIATIASAGEFSIQA